MMIDGAVLLDKPVGITSNRALQEAKKIFQATKAGHAGTLDPLASGLLIVLFGEATKFAGHLLDDDKEYLATLKLGEKTETGDAEGKVIATKPVTATTGADLERVLKDFEGEIEQVPPMHSALKRGGVPLYALARKGETVERERRRIRIEELELVRVSLPLLEIRIRCSKGTYVRTLAEDIGEALGTCAHLAALRRTASGRWRVGDAHSLEQLSARGNRYLISLAALLAGLPRVELDAVQEARFRNGQSLESFPGDGLRAVYGAGGAVIGLGQAAPGGALRPLRLVAQAADKHQKTL